MRLERLFGLSVLQVRLSNLGLQIWMSPSPEAIWLFCSPYFLSTIATVAEHDTTDRRGISVKDEYEGH